jgi:hypothetical protein
LGALTILAVACTQLSGSEHGAVPGSGQDSVRTNPPPAFRAQALVSTRFNSLDHFKQKVDIAYFGDTEQDNNPQRVVLTYTSNGHTVESELVDGIDQEDILKVRDGSFLNKAQLVIESPFSIRSRTDLADIYMMARRRYHIYGEGDVAFYDLAEASVEKITTPELAYLNPLDSSDKGLVNTFNHVTAQAVITSFFSQEIADFIADVHERYYMPELTHGRFTLEQLQDSLNNPVDNYVDMINNELGQQLGLYLKEKHGISARQNCTPQLLTDYMNDLQAYYSWSLGIASQPFSPDEELMIRFSEKLNSVLDKANL